MTLIIDISLDIKSAPYISKINFLHQGLHKLQNWRHTYTDRRDRKQPRCIRGKHYRIGPPP